jgi:hypothetical protein
MDAMIAKTPQERAAATALADAAETAAIAARAEPDEQVKDVTPTKADVVPVKGEVKIEPVAVEIDAGLIEVTVDAEAVAVRNEIEITPEISLKQLREQTEAHAKAALPDVELVPTIEWIPAENIGDFRKCVITWAPKPDVVEEVKVAPPERPKRRPRP